MTEARYELPRMRVNHMMGEPARGVPIIDLAKVVRSKNSGPYELTLDLVFKDRSSYDIAVGSGIFTRELFARLYDIQLEEVLNVVHFAAACAVKATIVRPVVSGDVGETDVYGAQQHAPLLSIVVPVVPDPETDPQPQTTGAA
jgi:hypothetical protein